VRAERILALCKAKRLQDSAKMFADEGEKSFDVRGFERAAFAPLRCRRQIADAEQLAIFPNPGIAIIRSDLLRLTPSVNGNEPVGNRGGDVGRTAIDTNGETRLPNEPDQLQNARVVEQVDAIVGDRDFPFGSTDEDHAGRRERVAKFFDSQIAE